MANGSPHVNALARAAAGIMAAALLSSCATDTSGSESPSDTSTAATPSVTSTPSPSPSPSPTPPNTVLMHDGVLEGVLPESFEEDEWGSWTNGSATIGCWAWRDPTIPVDGVTPAQIMSTWITQWNDWGYYSAGEVQPFTNVNGYADSEIWYIVIIYETSGGDYDFEVWEPHAYMVDGDVFIECSARMFTPMDAPPYGWDAAFLPLVESITIVDRDALLPNVWGTERGDY